MIIMIPLVQLMLFGYAINTNPRHLPTAVLLQEQSDLGALDPGRARKHQIFQGHQAAAHGSRSRSVARLREPCCSRSRFRPISSARCAAATSRRMLVDGRCDRSGCRRLRRSARSAKCCRPRCRTTATFPSQRRPCRSRSAPTRATTRPASTQLNIVPGPGRHHSHHDHADLHRAVGDARDRARHHGKSARDADHAGRDHARQDRALRPGRLRAGVTDHRHRRYAVRRADGRQPLLLAALSTLFITTNLSIGYTFSTVAQNQLQAMQMSMMFFPAEYPAVRLHVPVRGHAGLGAMGRRSAAAHALSAHRPLDHAEGLVILRSALRRAGAVRSDADRHDDRRHALPPHARLVHRRVKTPIRR